MYRIETFALSCRVITNAVTLGDMIYLPFTSVIAKLYTLYGGTQSCRDTMAVTKLIQRITRERILYNTYGLCLCVNRKDEKLMKRL